MKNVTYPRILTGVCKPLHEVASNEVIDFFLSKMPLRSIHSQLHVNLMEYVGEREEKQ